LADVVIYTKPGCPYCFSAMSLLLLYLMQRLQAWLPLNPQALPNVPRALAFNTAASFTTNTNWQAYSGESTMSYFTQMAGLAYQNFVSAAVGIALAIAFIRGIAQQEQDPEERRAALSVSDAVKERAIDLGWVHREVS